MAHLAFMNLPGGSEWLIILVVALLIFGRRLPEVGRSLGKGIVEFKRGLKGVKDEFDEVDHEVRNAGDEQTPDHAHTPRQVENKPPDPPPSSDAQATGGESEKVRSST